MDQDTLKQFEKLSKQITGVKADLQKEITAVRTDLHKEITGVKADLQGQIGGIKTFLYKEMPTKQEMDERFTQLPTKEDFNILQTSVDAYAKQSKDYYQEVTVVVAKVSKIEAWIKQAAPKLGIEYKI
jgi:hypothetical protein